jgi:hypothetical protein
VPVTLDHEKERPLPCGSVASTRRVYVVPGVTTPFWFGATTREMTGAETGGCAPER